MANELPNDPGFLQLLKDFPKFHEKGGKILKMRHEVSKLSFIAKQDARLDKLEELQQQALELNDLYSRWTDTNNQIRSIERALASVGIHATLGIVPVIPIVVGVSITTALIGMTYVATQSAHQARVLQAIKEGWLTPEEAAAVSEATNPFSGALQMGFGGMGLAIAGAIAFFGWKLMRK